MLLELAATCALGAPLPPERCRCAVMYNHLTTVDAVRPFTERGKVAIIGRVIRRRESEERAPAPPTQIRDVPRWVDYDVVITASWGPVQADTIVLRSDGPWINCHVDLAVGTEYLVLGDYSTERNLAFVAACLSPLPLAKAERWAALLDEAAVRRRTGRPTGG